MKKLLILLVFFTGLNAKVSINNSDYTNSKLILGYWSLTMIEKDFTFYGEYFYKDNGTKEGIFEVCMQNRCQKMTFESTWKIKNGFLISSVQKSSSADLPIGTVIKDTIIKLDEKKMVLLSKDGKEIDLRLDNPKFFGR